MYSIDVAPLVGAWIEIKLKSILFRLQKVAPLVGAWIEINIHTISFTGRNVAPLVGAWIEIIQLTDRNTL